MTLAAGTRIGPYEVLAPLGAGGMGEVWRARDSRLERQVAIKVLPAFMADDAERLRRFELEARAAAALAHPNVLAVHDVGRHEGAPYLVCELVEGETLRQRLEGGPLPLRRAIDVGAQIARGLAAAHEAGIVHRDLKPENVMIGRDGRARILDFGLAKLGATPSLERLGRLSSSVTLTAGAAPAPGATEPGMLLGTVGYMSPEQARGEPADSRSDLFSLGVILHEMAAGQPPFRGRSPLDVLHAILRDDPQPLPEAPALGRVVARCLEKEPAQRFQSARDLAFHLDGLVSGADSAAGVPVELPRRRPPAVLVAGVAALVALAVGFALGTRFDRPPLPDAPRLRYLTSTSADAHPAASPDGQSVAFESSRDGRHRIWIKDLATQEETPLTEGPDRFPRFSPDGASILFTRFGDGETEILRVGVLGGAPRRVVGSADDADWSPDGGSIAYVRAQGQGGRLFTARIDGSGERALLEIADSFLFSPRFAPDGRRVAVVHTPNGNVVIGNTVSIVDLATGTSRPAFEQAPGRLVTNVAWSGDDALVVVVGALPGTGTGGQVLRLDLASGERRVLLESADDLDRLDLVGAGAAVFDTGPSGSSLLDLAPGGAARALTSGHAVDRQPVFDPRGGRVVFASNRSGNLDLWALALETMEVRRLTDDPADDWDPGFLADGRLLWSSRRSGNLEVWTAEPDGSSPRQISRDGVDAENPTATPDGEWVVYASSNPAQPGIWKVRADGSEATHLVLSQSAVLPEVSPDGRFVLYLEVSGAATTRSVLHVIRLDGSPAPFASDVATPPEFSSTRINSGRARWLGADRFVFTAADAAGRPALLVQDFRPGVDTRASQRHHVELPPEMLAESFGIGPDGRVVVAAYRPASQVLIADGLIGVARPLRR